MFKTAVIQGIVCTTLVNDVTAKIDRIIKYVPILIPNAETEMMFNDSSKKVSLYHSIYWLRIEKLLILNENIKLI